MTIAIENLRQRLRPHKPLVVTVILLVIVFALVFGWRVWRRPAAAVVAPEAVSAQLMTVREQSVPQFLEAVGTLEALRQVTLATEVSGRVVSIQFSAGETVGTGKPLVRLYDAPERADLAAAAAQSRLAQTLYERSLSLAPSGAEPVQTLQQREAELAQARAAVRQIEARLAQKVVRAPFPGLIGLRRVNLGQYVNPGDPLATITDVSRLYVNFTVPQQQLRALEVGASVEFSSDAFPGRTFTARINAIEPIVGSDTRNVQVQAVLDNRERILRPGLYVTARIVLPALERAIAVPATSIITSASGDTVIAVRRGVAVTVPVVAGQRIADQVVVERGLKTGDTIVTAGQLRVQPGARVVAVR